MIKRGIRPKSCFSFPILCPGWCTVSLFSLLASVEARLLLSGFFISDRLERPAVVAWLIFLCGQQLMSCPASLCPAGWLPVFYVRLVPVLSALPVICFYARFRGKIQFFLVFEAPRLRSISMWNGAAIPLAVIVPSGRMRISSLFPADISLLASGL